ncbi:MAG: TonB-dependent receptor [Ignavibacteria bacterium]|nr:TonB-dependent receptor [Ignavibacteria bacterium]
MRVFISCIALLAFFLIQQHARSQSGALHGIVLSIADGDTVAVPGAHVRVEGGNQGATSDADGHFSIPGAPTAPVTIIVSHVGFVSDTVAVRDRGEILVRLRSIRSLGTVSVDGERKGMSLAPIEFKTEVITDRELRKAPCCDLSSCFGSNAGVEPEVTDIITDTRELRMIGLSGVYTQVLVDNVPTLLSGVNQSYGLGFVPGTLIDRMYVTKGANSVLQGPEAISGLVNVMLREGAPENLFFFNAFANSFHERQANAHGSLRFGPWSMILAAHTAQPARDVDGDSDGFLDVPKLRRTLLFNKWTYRDEESGVMTTAAWKAVDEHRTGGQTGFDDARDRGGNAVYGQTAYSRRFEAYTRSEILIGEDHRLNLHLAASVHSLRAWYGTTSYDADQTHAYANAAYTHTFTEDATLTAGASLRQLGVDEDIRFAFNPLGKSYDGTRRARETVPGLFAEQKLALLEDALTLIGGVRADRDNAHGLFVTPRLFAKIDATTGTTVRLSAGAGYRNPLPFVENAALFASARDILLQAALKPERAVNYGASLTRMFELDAISGTLSLDLYRTDFTDQAIADVDSDPQRVFIRNADGPSFSTSILAEALVDIGPVEVKTAYTWTEAYETFNGLRRALPFMSRHKLLGAASCEFPEHGWTLSSTIEWHGPQRLPDTRLFPAEFRMPEHSDAFMLLNAQVAKRFGAIELYAGVENILDTRQDHPILNARNPFGAWFEPTFAWGPVKGREGFAGIRVRLEGAADDDEEEE